MDSSLHSKISVLMLPFLAHGHISPFFELAKQLSNRNFVIFLCSTPINLKSIKNRLSDDDPSSSSIQLVELHLLSSPDFPPHYHTTNGLPPHLFPTLRNAFETAGPAFSEIIKNIAPDLVIYDFQPSWPADIALSHNIPAVYFLTTAAAPSSLGLHFYKQPGDNFPFAEMSFPRSNNPARARSEDEVKILHTFVACFLRSTQIVLIKSFREIEGRYMDYLSLLAEKTVVPVGPLVHEPVREQDDPTADSIMSWLDKKDDSSVVFVCFGSENYLSEEEMEELANGLECSKVNFIWAVRFPEGEIKRGLCLCEGFIERVGERGLVVEGWAPQAKILGHPSTGGFLSHCGWSSVTESMMFGVPIIGMPLKVDQPVNVKLVVEVGVGMEVKREKDGKFKREEIAEILRKVIVEESGEDVRRKAKESSRRMREKGDEDIDKAVEQLVQICRGKKEA